MEFIHEVPGQRVLFGTGNGAGLVAGELDRLGAARPMIVAARSGLPLAQVISSDRDRVLWWDEVAQHVPLPLAERARAAAAHHRADAIISIGGGSATGLAKAVALTTGIPIIAVPTTYAGSEATDIWGMTHDRTKRTGKDARTLPVAVVYDADLSKALPVTLSIASGLNALAHCIDSLWAPHADPTNQALALEGVRALSLALPGIAFDPGAVESREQALYGSYLAAAAFSSAGSGLHHKICHILGGTFELPHAPTHAAVLPHVLAFNAAAVPGLCGRLAAAFAVPSSKVTEEEHRQGRVDLGAGNDGPAAAVLALEVLYAAVDGPRRLSDYGFSASDIPEAATRILSAAPASNPVPVTLNGVTALLEDALTGRRHCMKAPAGRPPGIDQLHPQEPE